LFVSFALTAAKIKVLVTELIDTLLIINMDNSENSLTDHRKN